MRLGCKLDSRRSRFCIDIEAEGYDGRPGLNGVWFDGINEPIDPDAAALAAWILVAPLVSEKVRFSNRIGRLLFNSMIKTWGAILDVGEAHDEMSRFPERTGSVYIGPQGREVSRAKLDQPLYELEVLPLNASGTSYVGKSIKVKTNVTLLGCDRENNALYGLIATTILYADFLGILNILVPEELLVVHPPSKKGDKHDHVLAWGELLRAAGFNLQIC